MLSKIHDHVSGGPFGIDKTFQKAEQRYWWKRMFKDVEHWCRSCQDCSMRKSPINSERAPLLPIPMGVPFERIGLDVLGPFTPSSINNEHFVVFIDYLT